MMKKAHLLLAAAALAFGAAPLSAQVVSPVLFGFQRLALPGNSDSIVSLPFARPEAAAGLVKEFTGAKITIQGTPAWAANLFVPTAEQPESFYALVLSGTKEGSAYPITASDANSVTLDLEGDTLTGLTASDRLSIVPYWTLASLFPAGAGIHISSAPSTRATEVLFPDVNAPGVNASAASVFYFFNGHWLKVGGGATSHDNDPLFPDTFFTVRHNVPEATELALAGQVLPSKLKTVLGVSATGKRDNFLGLQRPVAVSLADSGLVSSGAFASSPAPSTRTDELLVFDNTIAGKNKSASATYYYWNSAWRKVGSGSAVFDTTPIFTPGAGFVIRKDLSASAPSWTNSPTY